MIPALARHTLRECLRRPAGYVIGLLVVLLAFASQLFQAFSFGAAALEAANLAISAVFVAGLVHAAFLGTTLVRADVERGTLGLLLSQPVGLPAYVAGRFLGLAASGLLLMAGVAALLTLLLLLPFSGVPDAAFGPDLYAGWLRTAFPVLILEAAALLASAAASRLLAPLLLLGLFLAGSLAASSWPGLLLPDFAVFALEAGPAPSLPWIIVYTLAYGAIFLVLTHLVLRSARTPLRSQS